jgi:hypothetical protein
VPTRVLLEGPAIEPLLAQVREEYGSSVRIISADKVRSGGFGGFFAKQRYELSVEVPDETEEPAKRPSRFSTGDEPPQTLEQLLARAESNDRIAGRGSKEMGELGVGIDASRRPGRTIDATVSDPLSIAGRDAGMGDAEAATGGLPPRPGALATDTAFADLMAGLDSANAAAAAARDAKDDDENHGKPTVRPFRPSTAEGSPINGATIKSLPPVPSLAELMGGLGLDDLIPPTDPTDKAPAPSPKMTRLQRSAAEAYGLSAASISAPPMPASPAGTPKAPAGTPKAPVVTPMAPSSFGMPKSSDPVVVNLMKVGMPAAMAAMIDGGDTYAGVLTALASRPVAPAVPDAPGEILVLAGELTNALPIARQIMEQIGLEQTHLLLAGPSAAGTGIHSSRVISGPGEAEKRAEKLQSAETPWVVVLDAPVASTDTKWVRETCEALGATAVWAVVDATRKTADTARHLSTLGEVEALVVHGVDVTSDPATVLGLDLPIVSLDGKPATPHAWAAMLCARIADDTTPAAPVPVRRKSRGR